MAAQVVPAPWVRITAIDRQADRWKVVFLSIQVHRPSLVDIPEEFSLVTSW